MATGILDRETILRAIENWPPDEQLALAREIARRAEGLTQGGREARPAVPSAALRGLLANGQPAPSDEEVARWLDEARMEKYGG